MAAFSDNKSGCSSRIRSRRFPRNSAFASGQTVLTPPTRLAGCARVHLPTPPRSRRSTRRKIRGAMKLGIGSRVEVNGKNVNADFSAAWNILTLIPCARTPFRATRITNSVSRPTGDHLLPRSGRGRRKRPRSCRERRCGTCSRSHSRPALPVRAARRSRG